MKSDISPARNTAYKILFDVLENKAFSNISVNNNMNTSLNGANDRALCVNIVYGTLKKYNRLEKIFNTLNKVKNSNLEKSTHIIILMSLYQLFYLDRVPQYAVVNDAVNMAHFFAGNSATGFVNAVLRNALRNQNSLLTLEEDFDDLMYYEYGFEKWITKLLLESMSKEELLNCAKEFEKPSDVILKVNTLKVKPDELISQMADEGYTLSKTYVPTALKVTSGANQNIFKTKAYKEGLFYAQDLSGIISGYVLGPKNTDTIIDICSAPGGKSFNASIISQKAKVTSCDNNQAKLMLLMQSAKQLGLDNIRTSRRNSANFTEKDGIVKTYSKIIADVPCSGLGVIQRKPEILRNITPEHIEDLKRLQFQLISENKRRLNENGIMIYSTCTLNQDENEKTIEKFLSRNDDFRLKPIELPFEMLSDHSETKDGLLKLMPYKDDCDGFFMARLRKIK